MFCSYCGKSVKDGSKFCVYCGKKLITDEDGSKETQQPKRMRPDANQAGSKPSQPGAQQLQNTGRIYFSSERRVRKAESQTAEILRQTDISLEQRARQADIQREQEKLSGVRMDKVPAAGQSTGRIYDHDNTERLNAERQSEDRQPFTGKRKKSGSAKKSSKLPLLIILLVVIAALAAAVWFFVVPMFDPSSGVENTITKLEEALNERDNNKLLTCFDRETNALDEDAFTSSTRNARYDLKITETFETDSEHMTAYVTFAVLYNDNSTSELVPLPMVKQGNSWYITKAGWDNVCGEIPTKN